MNCSKLNITIFTELANPGTGLLMVGWIKRSKGRYLKFMVKASLVFL